MTVCPNIKHNLSWKSDGTVTPCNNLVEFSGSKTVKEMMQGQLYRQLSQDHHDGCKSLHCQRCWDKEQIGLTSKRQSDSLLHEIYQKIDPGYMKIDGAIGSKCNAACRICNPASSSLWQRIMDIRLYNNSSTIWTEILDRLDHVIQMDFGGGEPWINDVDQQIAIFEEIVRRNRHHLVKIRYNTNGSIWPNRVMELLSNFRQVEITLSLDDIEQRFEYNRWPLRWDLVQLNLDRLLECRAKNPWLKITINFTISVFTWLRAVEFTRWCQKRNLSNINYNILQDPGLYCIKSLPPDTLQRVGTKTRFDDLVGSSPWPNWRENFLSLTGNLDKQRQQDIRQTFPELGPLLCR